MELEKISIGDITADEYRKAAALLPHLKNRQEDDIKRTLAGRILLRKMVKRLYGKTDFDVKTGKNGNASV